MGRLRQRDSRRRGRCRRGGRASERGVRGRHRDERRVDPGICRSRLLQVAGARTNLASNGEGGRLTSRSPSATYATDYVVTADGQRFLVNTVVDQPARPALTVIGNWTAELKN